MPRYTATFEAFADIHVTFDADDDEHAEELAEDVEQREGWMEEINPYIDIQLKSGPTRIDDGE